MFPPTDRQTCPPAEILRTEDGNTASIAMPAPVKAARPRPDTPTHPLLPAVYPLSQPLKAAVARCRHEPTPRSDLTRLDPSLGAASYRLAVVTSAALSSTLRPVMPRRPVSRCHRRRAGTADRSPSKSYDRFTDFTQHHRAVAEDSIDSTPVPRHAPWWGAAVPPRGFPLSAASERRASSELKQRDSP
jgi:hypothetical protein